MFSLRIYIQILLRVAGIVLVALLGILGVATGKAVILGSVTLLLTLWLIARLVAYLNTSNRRIQIFLDAIQDNESMICFPEDTGSLEQQRLHAAFNRIHKLITENKQKKFNRELFRKETEAWDKLMRVLTHEIMNSIAPIVSLSGTLLSYFQTKGETRNTEELTDVTIRKTIRGLDTIKSQGQRLMNFTDSYRRLSYLQKPAPKPFPLSRLIQNLQLLFHTDLERLQIALNIQLPPAEAEVNADEELLSQVLVNLLQNSMQALSGQTDGIINIEVSGQDTNIIEITDNGPGIPREILEDIFVPFFTTKTSGSGIGLSLSRQIIRMHGGDLTVSSQPYSKTTFRITLPSAPFNNHS